MGDLEAIAFFGIGRYRFTLYTDFWKLAGFALLCGLFSMIFQVV